MLRCLETEVREICRRTHESTEPLESPRDAHMRVDLDEHALGGVDVDLEKTGLIERRVKKSEETLEKTVSQRAPV